MFHLFLSQIVRTAKWNDYRNTVRHEISPEDAKMVTQGLSYIAEHELFFNFGQENVTTDVTR